MTSFHRLYNYPKKIVNQDHMTHPEYFKTGPAEFTVTKDKMKTRYAIIIIRTEVFDGSDSNDLEQIHKLQVFCVNK